MISFEKVFLLKLIFCFLSSLLIILLSNDKLSILNKRNSLFLSFFALRILPFIVIYLFLDQIPRGDIPFFFPKAKLALEGKLVYKDFLMYHAPIFPYIISLPLFFWQNPKALVLFFLIGEFITLQLTIRYLKLFVNSEKVIYLSNLYLLLPAPLIIVLLGGQEDIWLWGVLVLGLIIYFKSKNIVYLGLILSILLIALKFTAVVIFIPLFFMLEIKDKIKLAFSVAIPTILTLGFFYFKVGNDLFMFIKHTEDPYSPNLYSISSPVLSPIYQQFNLTQLNWIFLLLLLTLLAFIGFTFKKLSLPEALPYVWIISFGLFNILLPASMLYYTFIYLITIWFYLVKQDSKINILIFLLFNTLIISQPYLFVNQGGIIQSNFSFFTDKIQIIEYITELLSVALILFYCFQSWKKLIQQKNKMAIS